jgi:histidyl-tRNA synthetase
MIGENELAGGVVSVKNMLTGERTEKLFDKLPAFLGGIVFSRS